MSEFNRYLNAPFWQLVLTMHLRTQSMLEMSLQHNIKKRYTADSANKHSLGTTG